MPTYTLNFSCSRTGVIAQYNNLIRLSYEGYKRIMDNCLSNAQYLANLLSNSGHFDLVNDANMLPIVVVKLKDSSTKYNVFELSERLRIRGWILAACTLPIENTHISLLRIVVREHFSRDMADILYKDIIDACSYFK